MAEILLYGCPGSGSAAVEMGLRQAGWPYRMVRAARWEPGAGFDDLLRLNPLGQVPSLRLPEGSVLSESAAILITIGLHAPTSDLLPQDAARRAQAIRGLVYIAANCYSRITLADYPERGTTDTAPAAHDAVRHAARQGLHAAWTVFADQFFGSHPYLADTQPGALDFLAVVVSRWCGARAHLQQQRPAFHDFLLHLQQHPAVAPVWAEHWPTA